MPVEKRFSLSLEGENITDIDAPIDLFITRHMDGVMTFIFSINDIEVFSACLSGDEAQRLKNFIPEGA